MAIIVTGDKELTRAFQQLNDKVTRSELIKIQKKAISPLKDIAERLTPVKTGKLKKTIKIFTGKNKEFPMVMIGHAAGRRASQDGFYGFWVHEGTGGRKKGGRHKASNHLETASGFNEVSEEIIFKELSNLIDAAWK
jgi:hypothetical protein